MRQAGERQIAGNLTHFVTTKGGAKREEGLVLIRREGGEVPPEQIFGGSKQESTIDASAGVEFEGELGIMDKARGEITLDFFDQGCGGGTGAFFITKSIKAGGRRPGRKSTIA